MLCGFDEDHRHGVGEIETADRAEDGDADQAVGPTLVPMLGEAGGFATKDEDILVCKGLLVVAALAKLTHEVGLAVTEPREKIILRCVDRMREVGPVVQAGTSECLLGEFKSQRLDQVQMRIKPDTQAADVAGVGWDERLVEDHVEHGDNVQDPSDIMN